MTDAIANNKIGDLWKETWKIKSQNNVKPGSVDGHVNDEQISQQVFGENIIIYTIVFHTLMMICILLNRKLMTGWIWLMKFIKWCPWYDQSCT